jgi:hypothetical protein
LPKFYWKISGYVNYLSTFSTEFSTGDNVENSVEKVEIPGRALEIREK